MTYPQPDSNQVVINNLGSDIFRFSTLLASPGDIYESQQSGYGFAIGPDSDVAHVTLAYLDSAIMPPSPTNLATAQVSVERAFAGFIAARNDTQYIPAGYGGRILFFSTDVYYPGYQPRGYVQGEDKIIPIVPNLDLIQYLNEAPSVTPPRSDKTYRFTKLTNGPGGETSDGKVFLVLPFYGRTYASVIATPRSGDVNLTVKGVTYATNDAIGVTQGTEIEIGSAAIVDEATGSVLYNALTNGMFDALVIEIEPVVAPIATISINLTVVISDLPK